MRIVQEHFGLHVYLGIDFAEISSLRSQSIQIVFPLYRGIIEGRTAMAIEGLSSVQVEKYNQFNFVGSGSNTADVMVELVRRRKQFPGEFHLTIHFRTARPVMTWISSNALVPGMFPFYQFIIRNRAYDGYVFGLIKNQHFQSYRKTYFGEGGPVTNALNMLMGFMNGAKRDDGKTTQPRKTNLAGLVQLLIAHPEVAERLRFEQITDRAQVNQEPVLDCTNGSTAESSIRDAPEYDVDFMPDLRLKIVERGLPACLNGQQSTCMGAMSHALHPDPDDGSDARMSDKYGYASSASQMDACKIFAQYHSVAWLWVRVFHRQRVLWQVCGMVTYEILTRLAIWTGVSLLFFNMALYRTHPYIDGIRAQEIAKRRWEWFNREVKAGHPFPVSESMMRNNFLVPRCFDFNWTLVNAQMLLCRLTLILSAVLILSALSLNGDMKPWR